MDLKAKADILQHYVFNSSFYRFEGKIIENTKFIDAYEDAGGVTAVIGVKVTEDICNFMGNTHGAAIATMIDNFSSFVCYLMDPTPRITVSLELNANYIASSSVGDELIVKATCHKIGKNLAFTDVKIYCKEKLVAQGRDTKYVTKTKIPIPEAKL